MKIALLFVGFLFTSSIAFGQEEGNYIIIINGDSLRVNLDSDYTHKTSSGEKISFRLMQPDVLTYTDDMISFQYDKIFKVTNAKVDEGIEQCAILNSTGTGFMVQKYKTIDPSGLTQLMMNEITKESVNYGYAKSEIPFSKTLESGHTLQGVRTTLTYKGEKEIYTVAAYGGKDEGILVVTMLLSEGGSEDSRIIDLFLETLKIL